jgi:capping protein alpha
MSEFDEISPEEKLQIAKHYLLSSPPGQFTEVLADVKNIVSDEILNEDVSQTFARVVNLRQARIVSTPNGQKALIVPAAEVEPEVFFEPVEGSTFRVDHLCLSTDAVGQSEQNADETQEKLRRAIQSRLNSYVKSAMVTDMAAGGAYHKDGGIFIVIAGERSNLKSFWSGKFQSQWNVTVDGSTARLSGESKIHVHYFEDGNLQMQTSKSFPAETLNWKNEVELADAIFTRIQAFENALQNGLDDMYTNMNNETFKSMRRIMPITKTKMDWNLNAVRMVRQVRK